MPSHCRTALNIVVTSLFAALVLLTIILAYVTGKVFEMMNTISPFSPSILTFWVLTLISDITSPPHPSLDRCASNSHPSCNYSDTSMCDEASRVHVNPKVHHSCLDPLCFLKVTGSSTQSSTTSPLASMVLFSPSTCFYKASSPSWSTVR